jgi:carbamoyltransferase
MRKRRQGILVIPGSLSLQTVRASKGGKMLILGIHDSIDSGAAIIQDGKVLAAIGEERTSREKLAYGFPRSAISAVMKVAGVEAKDVNFIAVATKDNYLVNEIVPFKGWFETRPGLVRPLFLALGSKVSPLAARFPSLERSYYSLRYPVFANRRRKIPEILENEFGLSCPVAFIDHHFAHACSAYYSSDYENATVVTLDGGGDGLSSQVYDVRRGEFQKLNEITSLNSIGNFYSYVTYISGFKTHRHEGKITGLAAYGKPQYIDLFRSLINLKDGMIFNRSKLFGSSALNRIKALLPKDFDKADLAASIQQHLEEVVVEYVRHWLERTKIRDLALAGGVFANVKLNQKLHELEYVRNLRIHPAMGDDGIALGAALGLYYRQQSSCKQKTGIQRCLDHVYLGPEFSETEIKQKLEGYGLSYTVHRNIEAKVAQLLSQGHVVARFNGRMEYGPRALGNRSILYQTTDRSVNNWLNTNLKRTEFMPFAPSTLAEYARQSYVNVGGASDAARFMTITFECTNWMKEHCPGVVHVDGTARPQLVRKEDNPSYYKIIDEYRKITGLPSIINTSFNIHEEPIVCTPEDAIRAFKIGHLDYLAIGSFLVENPQAADTIPLRRENNRHVLPVVDQPGVN